MNSYQTETNKRMNQSQTQYSCPVEVTVEVIGGKWKCTILWWLRRGPKRFGELLQLIPRINRKVLTNQLRELERDGLIERQAYQERPPRVEYSLTSLGETLEPITNLMCDWGKVQKPGYIFGLLDLEGVNILVVADDPSASEQIRVELGTIRGAQVSTVSLVLVSESLPQIHPDAVVVDLSDFGGNLSPLIRQIQLLTTSSGEQTPAIALAEGGERTQAFSSGFKLILAKPFEPSELVAAIASVTGTFE